MITDCRMELYLFRHAESINNALITTTGSDEGRQADPELTESGHQQAQKLADFITSSTIYPIELTHLYCSLMTRSILTGEYIAEACGLELTADPDIFEYRGLYDLDENGGMRGVSGPGRSYFKTRFRNLRLPQTLANQGWYKGAAEELPDFLERVQKVHTQLLEKHLPTNSKVGLVVHGDFIDQFINHVMGVDRHCSNYIGWGGNWTIDNTSITRIDFTTQTKVVVYINRCDHLKPTF